MKEFEQFILRSKQGAISSEMVICTCCKGEGVVTRQVFYGHTDGWMPDHRPCIDCEGKGRKRKFRVEWEEPV